MKKLLGIVFLGLLLSGNAYAETEESIRDKYKSELPKCEGGVVNFGDLKKYTKWNNCFGKLKFDTEPVVFFESEFKDGEMSGRGNMTWQGDERIWFIIFTKNGCKRNGHAVMPDGRLFKVKYNKDCDIIKETPIK